MGDKVTFVASFPAIQSAIKISGDGNGLRIMLDVPENQMNEAVKLLLYRQSALRVTIEAIPNTFNLTASKPKSEEDLLDEILDDNPNL
jgi:hypothetical protein